MNILYNIKSLYGIGGMEAITSAKANYLADIFNFNVTIACTDDSEKKISWKLSPRITLINFDIRYGARPRGNYIVKCLRFLNKIIRHKSRLKKHLAANNYDIIISTGYEEKWFLPFIRKSEKTIRECHFHRYFMYNKSPNIIRKTHTIIDRYFASTYDKFVVLTQKDRLQWKLKNTVVISNCSRFSPEPSADMQQDFIVLAVGRLEKDKGFDRLLDIWHKLSLLDEFDKRWKLAIAGTGSEYEALKKKANDSMLHNSAAFYGAVYNMDEIYKKASILTCTSRQEPFGLFIVEAFSYGIPCVSFDCPCGPSEIIRNESGFLVPDGDTDLFCQKLLLLMNNAELRKTMGANARGQFENYFSIDKIMPQWKNLFEELAQ